MAYFIERKNDFTSFTHVAGVEVPIRSLFGPYERLSDATDMIAKMTNHSPREGEWQIWDFESLTNAAAAA